MTTAILTSSHENSSAPLSLYGWQSNRQAQAMECLLDYLKVSPKEQDMRSDSSCEDQPHQAQ